MTHKTYSPNNSKGSWRQIIEDAIAALPCADIDEPETAQEIINTGAANDAILLVMQDGQLHQRAITYAVNLCHRMECGLAVLHIGSAPAFNSEISSTLATLFEGIRDLPASLHLAHGELPRTVRRFLDTNRNIVSVVVDDITMEQNSAKRRPAKRRKWWQKLRCPVIFIPAT